MTELLERVSKAAQNAAEGRAAVRGKDGLRRCPVCGEALEGVVFDDRGLPLFGGQLLPLGCRCDREREVAEKRRKAKEHALLRMHGSPLYEPGYERMTFAMDANPDSSVSRSCRNYAANWKQMEQDCYGLLFTGAVGTGKTFYAAAIVNALLEQGVPGLIVTTARLLGALRTTKDANELLDGLNRFPLVVLDDFGAERSSDYSVEQLEAFVNSRLLTRKPLIVTTNRTYQQLRHPEDLRLLRLYDRVLELCCLMVSMAGQSRRGDNAAARGRACKRILEA